MRKREEKGVYSILAIRGHEFVPRKTDAMRKKVPVSGRAPGNGNWSTWDRGVEVPGRGGLEYLVRE